MGNELLTIHGTHRRLAAALAISMLVVFVVFSRVSAGPTEPSRSVTSSTEAPIALQNDVRSTVQIDTPEVFFRAECYGRAASLTTKGCSPLAPVPIS